jgi:hypothetical protein
MLTKADNWDWWIGAWKGLIICGACKGLMYSTTPCSICGQDYRSIPPQKVEINGEVVEIKQALMGAINWSDYVLLRLMHQEWRRPVAADDNFAGMPRERQPSSHLSIVILYWSLFENLIQRLLETALQSLPSSISRDLLNRYSSIGSRMDRLYKIVFDSTLGTDLTNIGYGQLWNHLSDVHKRRNAFIHGEPETINEELVNKTVEYIPVLQEAWIRLYNSRCACPK